VTDAEDTKAWLRAHRMACKMGYDIRECRIFAMAYVKGWKNRDRQARRAPRPGRAP